MKHWLLGPSDGPSILQVVSVDSPLLVSFVYLPLSFFFVAHSPLESKRKLREICDSGGTIGGGGGRGEGGRSRPLAFQNVGSRDLHKNGNKLVLQEGHARSSAFVR